jgi:hypothetical protein
MTTLRKKLSLLITSMITLTIAAPASAWSEETHMTTGAIAFDDLNIHDPATIAEIEKILVAHPHYNKFVAHADDQENDSANKTRVMFEWLARWPDDIRGTEYDSPDWHYELRVVYGRTWMWPFRNGNATIGFDESFRILSDKNAPAKDRAIAIGWLMHITGDMQQPLHAGHQMTDVFWATDEAGQLSYVRKTADGPAIPMHNYWDQILDGFSADSTRSRDTTTYAWTQQLQTLWPRGAATARQYGGSPQEQFAMWIDESMHLARLVAYTGTYLQATADQDSAPLVTSLELRTAQELSKRRVATGGYRIAEVLRLALKGSSKP